LFQFGGGSLFRVEGRGRSNLTGIGEFRGLAAVLLVVYDLGLLEVEAVESQVLSVIAITQLRSGVPVVT
jgi:hypothetical protein